MGITSDASGNGSPSSIRLATERDAEEIASIYAPNVTDTIISFELEPPTADEMRLRIEATLERCPWLVCEREGRVLGYAYADAHGSRAAYRWSVDVSVYVHEDARRMGLGRALYTSLFAALDLQGFYNAYAGATLPNPASVGLHEAVGFRPVGVCRSCEATREPPSPFSSVLFTQLRVKARSRKSVCRILHSLGRTPMRVPG